MAKLCPILELYICYFDVYPVDLTLVLHLILTEHNDLNVVVP